MLFFFRLASRCRRRGLNKRHAVLRCGRSHQTGRSAVLFSLSHTHTHSHRERSEKVTRNAERERNKEWSALLLFKLLLLLLFLLLSCFYVINHAAICFLLLLPTQLDAPHLPLLLLCFAGAAVLCSAEQNISSSKIEARN